MVFDVTTKDLGGSFMCELDNEWHAVYKGPSLNGIFINGLRFKFDTLFFKLKKNSNN